MIHEVETFDVSKCGDPRTEECNRCNHHSFLRWKHFKPEEWVRSRIGREETKYFLEIRVERMVFRERESRWLKEVSCESSPTASALNDW